MLPISTFYGRIVHVKLHCATGTSREGLTCCFFNPNRSKHIGHGCKKSLLPLEIRRTSSHCNGVSFLALIVRTASVNSLIPQ